MHDLIFKIFFYFLEIQKQLTMVSCYSFQVPLDQRYDVLRNIYHSGESLLSKHNFNKMYEKLSSQTE